MQGSETVLVCVGSEMRAYSIDMLLENSISLSLSWLYLEPSLAGSP